MITNNGQSRTERYTSGTYDGFYISAFLVAQLVNVPLVIGDLIGSQISIKVILKRKKETKILMQDNLQLIGTFATFGKNYHEFANGIDKVYAGVATKAVKVRGCKVDFGGFIRLSGKDELTIEVSVPQNSWLSANVDVNASYIEFDAIPAIGYETHVPFTKFEVVNANANKLGFSPGDNVLKMVFLNFDKNDLSAEIISNLSIASDRWDINLSFNQLMMHSINQMQPQSSLRYGTSLPISASAPTIRRGLDYLPQSFMLFNGNDIDNELDSVRVDISFNAANVATSQNYLAVVTYETTIEVVQAALARQTKHIDEKLSKVANPVA